MYLTTIFYNKYNKNSINQKKKKKELCLLFTSLRAQNAVPIVDSGLFQLLFSHAQALFVIPSLAAVTLDLKEFRNI